VGGCAGHQQPVVGPQVGIEQQGGEGVGGRRDAGEGEDGVVEGGRLGGGEAAQRRVVRQVGDPLGAQAEPQRGFVAGSAAFVPPGGHGRVAKRAGSGP